LERLHLLFADASDIEAKIDQRARYHEEVEDIPVRLEVRLDRTQLVVEETLADDLDGGFDREKGVDDKLSMANDQHHIGIWVLQWIIYDQHNAADDDQYLDDVFKYLAWMSLQVVLCWQACSLQNLRYCVVAFGRRCQVLLIIKLMLDSFGFTKGTLFLTS
jgi:hypothetical protein